MILSVSCTGTIGRCIAAGLASYHIPTAVILCSRNMDTAQQLQRQLIEQSNNKHIYTQQCDLSSIGSISDTCNTIVDKYGRVNVVLNGAACVPTTKQYSVDGIEMQFAVNIFSYYLLAELLLPALKHGSTSDYGSRVVNVASKFGSDFDINDLYFDKRTYVNKDAHHAAKQANRMLTHVQADKYRPYNISCFAVHPGIVMSNLLQQVGVNKGYNTPEQGAATPLYAANDVTFKGKTDLYVENKRVVACKWQNNSDNIKLYDYLQALKQKHLPG